MITSLDKPKSCSFYSLKEKEVIAMGWGEKKSGSRDISPLLLLVQVYVDPRQGVIMNVFVGMILIARYLV